MVLLFQIQFILILFNLQDVYSITISLFICIYIHFVCKSLKTLIKAQQNRTVLFDETNKNDITSELISFITNRSEMTDFIADALKLQYNRAIGRWRALEYFHKLAQYLTDPELIVNALYPLIKAFKKKKSIDDQDDEKNLNND